MDQNQPWYQYWIQNQSWYQYQGLQQWWYQYHSTPFLWYQYQPPDKLQYQYHTTTFFGTSTTLSIPCGTSTNPRINYGTSTIGPSSSQVIKAVTSTNLINIPWPCLHDRWLGTGTITVLFWKPQVQHPASFPSLSPPPPFISSFLFITEGWGRYS